MREFNTLARSAAVHLVRPMDMEECVDALG
jgi:hypothetical protein